MSQDFYGFSCICFRNGKDKLTNSFKQKETLMAGDSAFLVNFSEECIIFKEEGIHYYIYGYFLNGLSANKIPGLYKKHGKNIGTLLAGSFAILIIDSGLDKAILISDKVASVPLFISRWQDSWMISTSFKQMVIFYPYEPSVNISGICWLLTNGGIHNNHTILNNIQRLDRATIYIGDAHSFTGNEYWSFNLLNVEEGKSSDYYRNELLEVLIHAVKDSIPSNRDIFLSLSAGYDSRGILAIMRYYLGLKNVKTFSYSLFKYKVGSDAYHAMELASKAGYHHDYVLSYNSNLKKTLELNTRWGDGISNFCEEVTVWDQLRNELNGYQSAGFFGDTIFAGVPVNGINHEKDALLTAFIKSDEHINWLAKYIPQNSFGLFSHTLNDECEILLQKARKVTNDLDSICSYLRLEARIKNVLVPWRHNFSSRAFNVFNPLQHDDCLEYQMTLPSEFRRDKYLFKKAIEKLAPQLSRIEKARFSGYKPDWSGELYLNHDMIIEDYLGEGSDYGLESIISLTSMKAIFKEEIIRKQVIEKRKRLPRTIAKHIPYFKIDRLLPPNQRNTQIENFMLRYLVLKSTLKNISQIRTQNNLV